MSYVTLIKGGAPSTPASGKITVYVDSSDGRVKVLDDAGVTYVLTPDDAKENLLYNGGFNFAQRQAPATLTTYSNTTGRSYGADRWGITNENASVQYQRVDSVGAVESGLNAEFYGKFKKITSAGKVVVSQVIEAVNTAPVRGRKVRLQAKLLRTVAGAMKARLGLLYLTSAGTTNVMPATFVSAFGGTGTDPTWGTNLTALTPSQVVGGTIVGNGVDCVLTAAWARFSAVFDIPTTAKNLIPVIWSDAQLAANDELNMTEVGIYDGPELTDWTPRPYAQDLALCQRYYQKSFAVDTAPAQNVGAAGSNRTGCLTAGAVANSVVGQVRHVVPLFHALGAITFYNPSAANAFARNVTRANDATVTAAVNPNTLGFHWNCTGVAASWVVGDDVIVHHSVEADF